MNKSGVFLFILILLLGVAAFPSNSVISVNQIESNSSMIESAVGTTGTLRIIVSEDVGVATVRMQTTISDHQ